MGNQLFKVYLLSPQLVFNRELLIDIAPY